MNQHDLLHLTTADGSTLTQGPASPSASDRLRSSYLALASQLRGWATSHSRPATLGLAGRHALDQASSVAVHLAQTLACEPASSRVLLIEARFENSSLFHRPVPGLAEILRGRVKPERCLVKATERQPALMSAGLISADKARSLPWMRLRTLCRERLGKFDYLIFDLPSLDRYELCCSIASQLNGLILVSQQEMRGDSSVNQVRQYLKPFPVAILGQVISEPCDAP